MYNEICKVKKVKNSGFLLSIVVIFFISFLCVFLGLCEDREKIKEKAMGKPGVQTCFYGVTPVSISGYIRQEEKISILSIAIKNNTENTISAVKFYVVCYNVYGEKIEGAEWAYTYQSKCIEKGKSKTHEVGVPKYTKSVRVYTYSVYYKNNERVEWGTRKISTQDVKEYAPVTCIEYAY